MEEGARKKHNHVGDEIQLVADDGSKSFSSQGNVKAYNPTEESSAEGAIGNLSSLHDHHAQSCTRSVGSVGSHGSGDRSHASNPRNHHPFHRQFPVAYLMNGEPRFPSASSYAASEAGKSDVATVCSGSVVEDIEVSSVMSGGDNSQSWGASINTHPSPPSSVKVAPAVTSGGSTRRVLQGRGVEFADSLQQELMLSTVVPHNNEGNPQFQIPSRWQASENEIAMVNNSMGPPLSRALLLQHPQFGSFSRAESVKSFGSNAGSDVVAHVDTDDCGGSLVESVTDGHSVHSQEDHKGSLDDDAGMAPAAACATVTSGETKDEDQQLPHPWLRNGNGDSNGRVSPGGTIYRGRGVRRYKGRYMHLPLKRFHQDAMAMNQTETQTTIYQGYDGDLETVEPWRDPKNLRSRSESPPNNLDVHARTRSWSRSRSRSRSRSPSRNHNRSPKSSRSDRQDVGNRKSSSKNGDLPSRYKGHRRGGDRYHHGSGSKNERDERGSSRSPVRYKHRRK